MFLNPVLIFLFLRGLYARLAITTDPSPVRAPLGSDIVLKCDFTVDTPTPDLQYLIVRWFLNDKLLVEFNDKLIPSSSRVTMSERELQNGNASLSIPKVTPADEGDYKCFVLYTPDKEEKTIRLKVEAPPSIQVSDPQVEMGIENTLSCSASGYYPEDIRVMWLKDGQVLKDAKLSTPQRNTDGTFNISCSYTFTPTTQDKDKTYSCRVNHTALQGPIKKDLKLLFVAVPKVTVSEPLRNQDNVSVLTCEARGHYPKNITVEWRSGGQVQTDSFLVTRVNKDNTFNTINTYTFTSSDQDRGKAYSCHVSHISLKEPIQEDLILQLLDENSVVQERKSGLIRTLILAVLIPVVILVIFAVIAAIMWLIWRRRYTSEISFPRKYTLGQEAFITANLSYLFKQNVTAKWWLCGLGDSLVEITEREQPAPSESLPLITNEERVMSFTNEKAQNWPTKLLTSRLSYKPQVAEAGHVFICRFYRDGKEIPHTNQRTHNILIFARPEVSDIKEIPVSGEDEVKFTVDVSKFYPEEIQIHWSLNGKQLEGETSEPQCNVSDGTYSVTNQIVIPEGQLKGKNQIKVIIEHESMEKPAVKEKTLQDPATRRRYRISEISMPQKVIDGEQTTLSCAIGGMLPKSPKIAWIKKMRGDQPVKYMAQSEADFSSAELLVSKLTFTPNIAEDEEAEFICTFSHETAHVTLESGPAVCKVFGKPTVSAIEELPMTDKEVVNFALDVTEFYPRDIQIKWIQNGRPIPGQGEPQTNADGTYSMCQTVAIPEGNLKAGDKVGVSVEHISLESALTKEITAVDTATRRGYRISEISMPQNVTHGEQSTLTCAIGGILPKSQKITWIKKMKGDQQIKQMSESEADFSRAELLVSKLTFTPNIVEDEEAEFICRFSHESANVTMDSGPAVCKVFGKPTVSAIQELPVTDEEVVIFAVDVTEFYPRDIQIFWTQNGHPLTSQGEPQTNADGTYSIRQTVAIPEGDLKAGDKVGVSVEHASLESALTKEITAVDTATRRGYRISEISMPQNVIHGEQTTLTCAIGGILPKSPKITWIKKTKGDQQIKQMSESEADFSSAELLVSKLTFTPNIAEDEEVEFICRFSHESANVTMDSGPAVCKVFGKPTVSAIQELPVTDEEVVNFAVDVTEFYPQGIQIFWTQNGHPLTGQGEPQTNADGTYSIRQTVAIPEGDLMAGDKVGVSVEHASLESALTKEITAVDTATRRGYRISEISMPQNVIHGEQTTLTCAIGGILPKSPKITWIKKMKGDQQMKQMSESEADFSSAELLVSKLTFTANIAEDEEAEFICRFSHESANVTMDSGPAVCKVFGKPTVSAIQELPVTDEEVVNFAVDITEFYPQDIQIFWTQNGHLLTSQGEPQINADGTYSIRQTVAIPEGDLMAGDKVGVSVEHASLESALTKEITAVDTATRRGYRISEISMPQNVIHGEQTTLTCAIGGILPKSPKITWIKKMKGDQQMKQMSESEADFSSAELLVSKLTFTPNIAEDEEAGFICRFSHESADVTMDSGPAVCKVFGKPTVSAVQELPVTDEEVVNFAVDVTEFYPQDIQIFWTQNGHPLTSQGEPQTNSDGTYSIRQTVAIPEGDLMAGDKVGVSVEHASLESALTKEITAVDTATRRGYRISKISMPQNVIHGEQTTLTCAIGGILPKSPKITWIKKMKGDQQIKQMSESEADFSSAELLVSKLTFTANIAEDEEAEFICRFSHESANVTMNSGPAVCKVFGKPTVSTMQELPVTDEEVVNFPNNNIVASSP
ncbi:muscle M-line assembly protein unc-89 [Latimeria chalumnae]|uniref:muscle M-line assembly protein unc-89 n=1 Tax=Latimeria chalumnae TaxID=7897 RepID=UPI00313ECF78